MGLESAAKLMSAYLWLLQIACSSKDDDCIGRGSDRARVHMRERAADSGAHSSAGTPGAAVTETVAIDYTKHFSSATRVFTSIKSSTEKSGD